MIKVFFLFLWVLFFNGYVVKASEIGETVGFSVPIEGKSINDGNIICKENNKFELCTDEYSVNLAGVYNEKPALLIDDNNAGSKPLISAGKAWVLVSSSNGNIERGNYITTSKTAGVGMKAGKSGIILGIAMDNYVADDKTTIGKILVLVGIKSVAMNSGTGGNLADSVKQGFMFPNLDSMASLRYWLAILICIVSFAIGFIYFGRISKTGIEAMGRNPLAGKMIQVNIILNVILIILIMIGGLALSYAIVVI